MENIRINQNGYLKIQNFGIEGRVLEQLKSNSSSFKEINVISEQKNDIFELGVLMYELISGNQLNLNFKASKENGQSLNLFFGKSFGAQEVSLI